ncbi:hypothetical protein BDZ89DRAFT_1038367 [Hymenopellis radicata]|nr:hypothetical protein BDZ89DRAFT_1038367 [Hymenopellis radicata]
MTTTSGLPADYSEELWHTGIVLPSSTQSALSGFLYPSSRRVQEADTHVTKEPRVMEASLDLYSTAFCVYGAEAPSLNTENQPSRPSRLNPTSSLIISLVGYTTPPTAAYLLYLQSQSTGLSAKNKLTTAKARLKTTSKHKAEYDETLFDRTVKTRKTRMSTGHDGDKDELKKADLKTMAKVKSTPMVEEAIEGRGQEYCRDDDVEAEIPVDGVTEAMAMRMNVVVIDVELNEVGDEVDNVHQGEGKMHSEDKAGRRRIEQIAATSPINDDEGHENKKTYGG